MQGQFVMGPQGRGCVPAGLPGTRILNQGHGMIRVRAPGKGRTQMRRQRRCLAVVQMGLKAVENYDGDFELGEESRDQLVNLLKSETFRRQVVKECKLGDGVLVDFTGMLFQPVPWSPKTTKGMPEQYVKYLEDPEYTIINVPPNFMFQAKIFKPSRLCAIFKKTN